MNIETQSLFDKFVEIDWNELWEKVSTHRRYVVECDDREGILSVVASCDGDFHMAIDKGSGQLRPTPSFRSRTFIGGGRNERIRKALALLALAINEDTENK